MQSSLPLALVLLLAAPAVAQEPVPPAGIATIVGSGLSGVCIDEPGDGNVWVLAPGYKARFGVDGVDFILFYGSRAPRNFPVSFRLRSVARGEAELPSRRDARPVIDGMRIVYERGGVRETWHLRTHEVEQVFVVPASTARGDLVVKMDVVGDATCTDTADGLTFAHAGFGGVHYGDLTALSTHDTSCAAPSRWTGDAIELRVPASFADAASGPITIDPVIRSYTLAATGADEITPDIAYEPVTDRWLVVYERAFSVLDSDILALRLTGSGDVVDSVVVAAGSRESRRPSVAANAGAQQFMVVWDEDAGISDRVILGRTRTAGTGVLGTTFTIRDSAGATTEDRNPAIGGSTATDAQGAFYLVASELRVGSNAGQLQLTRVTAGGTILSSVAGAATDRAEDPVVTRARPTNGQWLIGWRTGPAIVVEATGGLNAPGTSLVVDPARAVAEPLGVAGNGSQFFVAYSTLVGAGNHDIRLAHLRMVRNQLTLVVNHPITTLEPGVNVAADQRGPAVAFDGCRVTYAYRESVGVAGDYAPRAAVVQLEPVLHFSDSHRELNLTTRGVEDHIVITSTGDVGGDRGRSFVAWDIGGLNLIGCLFHGTTNTTGVTMLDTACGALFEPVLTVENPPALGATVRLRATPIQPQSQVFFVGLPTQVQLCSASCILGVAPVLLTVPGASLNLPIGCDTNLLGAHVAVQNMLVGGPTGCTTQQFPFAFTISDTAVLLVQ